MIPTTLLGDEGFSSSNLATPANVYYRAFTIYSLESACEKSPEVSSIKLHVPNGTLYVGERLHANTPDDSVVSDFIIEAFDREGNFVANVPVQVSVYSVDRTSTFDPGIVYRDASMDYWEARKPGEFAVFVRWSCAESASDSVTDEVIVKVIDP